MSVLVHGEEKRESVVRELHGVGLEHREARAVGHDDVVGPPCARALSLCESRYRVDGVEGETPRARVRERDRVAQRRVGVAVAVRRPHAAAARPRSRDRRRRRVAGGVAVREVVPVRLGRALRSRPRALGAAAVRRAAALEGVAAACDRDGFHPNSDRVLSRRPRRRRRHVEGASRTPEHEQPGQVTQRLWILSPQFGHSAPGLRASRRDQGSQGSRSGVRRSYGGGPDVFFLSSRAFGGQLAAYKLQANESRLHGVKRPAV